MDDNITFNITTKPAIKKTKATPTAVKPLNKKQRAASSGFDFQFNAEKPKAKALVVRRRAAPVVKEQAAPQNTPLEAEAPVTASKVAAPNDGDLMFNVFTVVPKVKEPAKPKGKPTIHTGPTFNGGAAIDKQQLKAALKNHARRENPNKQPRAGDLFKAQMDEEYRLKRTQENPKTEETATESKTEARPKTDTPAKNKFRTKKIGLFDQSDVTALKQLGQRAVKPIKETIFTGAKVTSLGLHAHAVKNLHDQLSITELTTVQQKTIPQVLAGKDVLVRSQTGSGKTLAYALPVVERLQAQQPHIKRTDGVLALVIVPTRELAVQSYELFVKLLKPYTWIVPGALLGGESRKSEKARLRKGINVLLGTPGRLVDHLLHTATFKLSKLQYLVLDEADRLLELGYERDVKQLVEAIDKHRAEDNATVKLQRMLLSATLTTQVQQLAGLTLKDPFYIDNSDEAAEAAIKGSNGYEKETIEKQLEDGLGEYMEDLTGVLSIPETLQLSYVVVPPKLRLVTLSALLAKEVAASPKQFKAIVFMSTTEMVNFHHDMLNEALTRRVLDEDDEQEELDDEEDLLEKDKPLLHGLRFFKLHGSMTQTERQGVFRSFRDCASCVLLATDVIGRGIDVPDTKLVVQYTPAQTTADFVHRVGRTARAGRRGRAVLFLAPSEAQFVRHLENKRIRIQQGDMYSYLQTLVPRDNEARNVEEAASNLQHKFQSLLEDDRELHDKSCKAFVSWMKFYSTFPKELKPIFNVRIAHMGHFAKSFALKDAPSNFAHKHAAPKAAPPTNRLTYTERDPEKLKQEKRGKKRLYTTTVSGEVRQMQDSTKRSMSGQRHLADGNERTGGSPGTGGKNSFMKSLNKSRALNISEFDSGLSTMTAPPKKRKQS